MQPDRVVYIVYLCYIFTGNILISYHIRDNAMTSVSSVGRIRAVIVVVDLVLRSVALPGIGG